MKLLLILLASLSACGMEDTPGRRVDGTLSFANPGTRSWTTASGWLVELDEAVVLLGPLYIRPPKRSALSARALRPKVHAHAQTLSDGEVKGEYLAQLGYDALGPEVYVEPLAAEAGNVDRLSLMLDQPRSTDAEALSRGYHAYMRGAATRGSERVAFQCGLRIDAMAEEMPKNLEARRRIDNVAIAASGPMDDGMHLRVWVHPERWFDFVSFPDFVGPDDPCAQEGSAFSLQWYLGLRRPEAFTAELN